MKVGTVVLLAVFAVCLVQTIRLGYVYTRLLVAQGRQGLLGFDLDASARYAADPRRMFSESAFTKRLGDRVSAYGRRRVRECTATLSRVADRDDREPLACLGQLLTRWNSELCQRNDRTGPDEFAQEVMDANWVD